MKLILLNYLKAFPSLAILLGLFILTDLKQAFAQSSLESVNNTTKNSACPPPVLSRLQRHRIVTGETIESIAQANNLLPETLIRLNPVLSRGSASVGTEILIPPFNGIRIKVPAGATWKDLEIAYGVRADVLFEVNGCQRTPTVVFLPGINWGTRNSSIDTYTGLSSYPLPSIANLGLSYGWQINPTTQQRLFHSGIDLLAALGTSVLSAETGTIAFVGQQDNYGNLVVVNHPRGKQTRYAHLDTIQVVIGQQVNSGEVLGTVGTTGRPDLDTPHLHFEVRDNSPLGWVAQDPVIHLQSQSTKQQE